MVFCRLCSCSRWYSLQRWAYRSGCSVLVSVVSVTSFVGDAESEISYCVLKDGDLYENVALNENEEGYSVVSRYDWSGNKLTSYVLDKKLIYIAYNKNTDILYAISAADRLYSFKLR